MSFDLTNKNISATFQNVLQRTGSDNHLYDLEGNKIGDLRISGSLIAQEYIVSSSVTNISIATLSGSTAFGNSVDDTHTFQGNITSSGNISSSKVILAKGFQVPNKDNYYISSSLADIIGFESDPNSPTNVAYKLGTSYHGGHFGLYASNLAKIYFSATSNSYFNTIYNFGIGTNAPTKKLQVAGDISASGDIYLAGDQKYTWNSAPNNTYVSEGANEDSSTSNLFLGAKDNVYLDPDEDVVIRHNTTEWARFDGSQRGLNITGNITASGVLKNNGNTIFGNHRTDTHTFTGNITASGNISSSGTYIKGRSVVIDEIQGLTQGANVALNLNTNGNLGMTVANNKKFFFNEGANDGTSFTIQNSDETETFSVNGDDGAIKTLSHITASGNISASGTSHTFGGDITATSGSFSRLEGVEKIQDAGGELHFVSDDMKFIGDGFSVDKSDGTPVFTIDTTTNPLEFSFGTSAVDFGRKIITPGLSSTAHITASAGLSSTHITASGNITSSKLYANELHINSKNALNANDGKLNLGKSDTATVIKGSYVNITPNITASGNISSSGTIKGAIYELLNRNTLSNDEDKVILGFDTSWTGIDIGRASVLTQNIRLTGPTYAMSHITSSGNISASGLIGGSQIKVKDKGAITLNVDGDNILFGSDSQVTKLTLGKPGVVTQTTIDGNITASGDISSSGTITADIYNSNGGIGVLTATSTDVTIGNQSRKSNILGTNTLIWGPVTASGNISSSGYVSASSLTVTGDIVTPGDVDLGQNITQTKNVNGALFHHWRNDNAGSLNQMGMLFSSGSSNLYTGNPHAAFRYYPHTATVHFTAYQEDGRFSFNTSGSSRAMFTKGGAWISGSLTVNPHSKDGGGHITASGNISQSSTSTGSFGHIMKGGVNWDTAVSASAAAGGFGSGGGGGGSMTSFQLEDGDGTEVAISDAKEVKFVEGGGIDINWTDTDNGTDGDPYDLTFTINSSQTGIANIYKADLKIGEDNETAIDFETPDEIHFDVNNSELVNMKTGGMFVAGNISASGDFYAGSTTGTYFSASQGNAKLKGASLATSNNALRVGGSIWASGSSIGSITASSEISTSAKIYGDDAHFSGDLRVQGTSLNAGTALMTGSTIQLADGTYFRGSGQYHNVINGDTYHTNAFTCSGHAAFKKDIVLEDDQKFWFGEHENNTFIQEYSGNLLRINVGGDLSLQPTSEIHFKGGGGHWNGKWVTKGTAYTSAGGTIVHGDSCLGVNTLHPSASLHVEGNIWASASSHYDGSGHITASKDILSQAGNIIGHNIITGSDVRGAIVTAYGAMASLGDLYTTAGDLYTNKAQGKISGSSTSTGSFGSLVVTDKVTAASASFAGGWSDGYHGNDEFIPILPLDFVGMESSTRALAVLGSSNGGAWDVLFDAFNTYAMKIIPKGYTAYAGVMYGNNTNETHYWYSSSLQVTTAASIDNGITATGTTLTFQNEVVGDGEAYVICKVDPSSGNEFGGGKIFIRRTT